MINVSHKKRVGQGKLDRRGKILYFKVENICRISTRYEEIRKTVGDGKLTLRLR